MRVGLFFESVEEAMSYLTDGKAASKAAEAEAEAQIKAEVKKITMEDLQAVAGELIKQDKADEVKQILKKLGVQVMTKISEKDFAKVLKELEAL